MATQDMQSNSWLTAYLIFRKKKNGRTLALVVERSFIILVFLTLLFVHFKGLSVGTFWHNALLMAGWPIWIGAFLIVRYEVRKILRRFQYAKI